MQFSDPNFKDPKSIQWNVDIQRALTNNLTLDVAYVGTHGYDETHSVDLNEPALGSGWDPSAIATCLGAGNTNLTKALSTGLSTTCSPDATAILNARPYNAQFPYYLYIVQATSGFKSNYSGLQLTLDGRNYHGLNFLAAYTYSHALDDWTKSSQNTSALANPANLQYQYGNGDMDVRHRLRFSPTYAIPGKKSPGQMLEGWQISGIWALQSGFAWAPNDQQTNDWGGTGENADNRSPARTTACGRPGTMRSSLRLQRYGSNPIPCYGALKGCTPFASAPAAIQQACLANAQAPYTNQQQQALAIMALTANALLRRKTEVF